jgi:uroporphyrinogen-III decarboxylase
MKERWIEPAIDADKKQEKFFESMIDKSGFPFENEAAAEAYRERCTIIKDAVQMKKTPKRVLIAPYPGGFPLEYYKVSWKEAMYNYSSTAKAYIKFAEDFPADTATPGWEITSGKMLDILDFKLCLWAGNGLEDNTEYQYIETDYLKADEYQDLIDDPTGWFLSVYYPRVFKGLEGFSEFPSVSLAHEIVSVASMTIPFAVPPLAASMETLMKASQESLVWVHEIDKVAQLLMAKGHPTLEGGFTKAPFDVLGDTLRGTKEIMMDLIRRPDEVIEACERLTPLMIKGGVRSCQESGNPVCFIPLHKGADGFISKKQFDTFYWPTLRKVCIGLIDQGVVPLLFAEGSYNTRLETISDLPGGKVIWYFDQTDMKRAKETVGKKSCIMGNVPVDLLFAGTVDEVKKYCKDLIQTAGKNGGYIFSSGGSGLQETKAENIKAMLEAAKEYGVYN